LADFNFKLQLKILKETGLALTIGIIFPSANFIGNSKSDRLLK